MGTINLNLPESMSEEARLALRQARLLGGPDTMPTPTAVTVDEDRLTLVRSEDSSGYLAVPMEIDGFGHLMTATATLIERFNVKLTTPSANRNTTRTLNTGDPCFGVWGELILSVSGNGFGR